MMKMSKIHQLMMIVLITSQIGYAQIAEDALRYSQLGLGVGARQLGMGNATVGGVDDYSALFWNPAGLALERNFEFSFGLSRMGYSNDVSYLGVTTSADKSVINLNNLGFVYPVPTVRGSLTFAFGFNRAANYTSTASMDAYNSSSSIIESNKLLNQPFDSNIPYLWQLASYDSTTHLLTPLVTGNMQQLIGILEGGGLNHWTLGGAIDIGKNLSVGVSLNYASGTFSYDRNFTENDTRNLHTTYPHDISQFGYESTYNDNINGFNALFGIMFRKPGKYSFGLAIRTATTYDISETFGDNYTAQFKTADTNGINYYSYSTSNSTKYQVTTPYVLSAGISLQALDWLLLAGDAEYTDWTQMELSGEGIDFSVENSRIRNQMQATTNLRGGVEVSLLKYGLKLRGGIIDNPSPWKGDPSSYDQLYYTAGIGFACDENTTINAAYAYGTWKTARINYSYTDASGYSHNVGTDGSITTSNLNLTLSYRF